MVTPTTIQMHSRERVTMVMREPKYLERYFLDYQNGEATLKPDAPSSLARELLPSLQKAVGAALAPWLQKATPTCTIEAENVNMYHRFMGVSELKCWCILEISRRRKHQDDYRRSVA
jgi:hypothetical protein